MGYVDVGGVRTWYEVLGEGEPLVLLHPGGFDSRAMAEPAAALAESYTVSARPACSRADAGRAGRPDVRGDGR